MGWEFFSSLCIQTDSGAHPASYPIAPEFLSLGIKRLGREADHSPPSNSEIKNAWSYSSTPQNVFMAWCSVKKVQGQLYLYLYNININYQIRHSAIA
jgi:hypothetical protein